MSVATGIVRDAQFREPIAQPGIEPAGGLLGAGHRLPGPVLERLLVRKEIAAGDGDPDRAEAGDQIPGRADFLREQLRVDRAAVDILQRDPAPRQQPVQFDDLAHEIRIGLLPERLLHCAQ